MAFRMSGFTTTTPTRRSLRRASMRRLHGWQRAIPALLIPCGPPTHTAHTRMPHRSWVDSGFVLINWEVRPRHGTLRRRGGPPSEPVRIEPRVMAVLACLARHVGEVVTRDELCAEVWGGRVVSDEALSRCISLLRHVLADDSREPRFIRTVARIGYTLVPTPTPLAGQPAPALEPEMAAAGTPLAPHVGGPALLRNRRLRR